MFSVICVYNNKKNFENQLLNSLKKQTVPYELIALNNSQNRLFPSAASALNQAAKKAKNKYLLFIHQDIVLNDKNWLKKAEKILDNLPDLGIAGVAGRNFQNQRIGYIDDAGKTWGRRFSKPKITQTLDECLLIIPKRIFDILQFDEKKFNHWHCYGVDYALEAAKMGFTAYVIPLFVHHLSPGTNLQNLFKYQKRVFEKHRDFQKYICTTCGFLSPATIYLKTKFPDNKLIEIFWSTAGESKVGKLWPDFFKRLWQGKEKIFKK